MWLPVVPISILLQEIYRLIDRLIKSLYLLKDGRDGNQRSIHPNQFFLFFLSFFY